MESGSFIGLSQSVHSAGSVAAPTLLVVWSSHARPTRLAGATRAPISHKVHTIPHLHEHDVLTTTEYVPEAVTTRLCSPIVAIFLILMLAERVSLVKHKMSTVRRIELEPRLPWYDEGVRAAQSLISATSQ